MSALLYSKTPQLVSMTTSHLPSTMHQPLSARLWLAPQRALSTLSPQGEMNFRKGRPLLTATRPQSSSFNQVDSYSFVLNIFGPEVKNIYRRQTSGGTFVNGQGTSTDTCSNAVVYTLVNGQLFANASSGTTQFGSNSTDAYTVFTPRLYPAKISGTFAVDSQNNLIWNNASFYNSFAQWCVRSDNSIVAVFVAPSLAPSDCVFVLLNMVRGKHGRNFHISAC
jgi:hypothetical protein